MAKDLKVNIKVNKFPQRSTSLIINDLKVNIIVNAPKAHQAPPTVPAAPSTMSVWPLIPEAA
jgi:hypothetical protein